MLPGLAPSEAHPENGMTLQDMEACERVASQLGEVIIFRSTGPWAKRWLAEGFPSKNFHVKGKSSNWGPQAGFVPYDGIYSKVGADPAKAAKGTADNDKGLKYSDFAVRSVLNLTKTQIQIQCKVPAEGRLAIASYHELTNGNIVLGAFRHGDSQAFTFIAIKQHDASFNIHVYPQKTLFAVSPALVAERDPGGTRSVPLEIMGSAEVGANGKAMTGDYDLLAVCPRVSDRGSQVGYERSAQRAFVKEAIHLRNAQGVASTARGKGYRPGVNMDNVLDARLHTASQQKHIPLAPKEKYVEHADMGNITPRILRCINLLNAAMGAVGGSGWQRRVHHNAESHRFASFGALTRSDMDAGDGFPFTAFLPPVLAGKAHTRAYTTVCTLENMREFEKFCADLDKEDYWVPKNYTWKMRNKVADTIDHFNKIGGVFGKRPGAV